MNTTSLTRSIPYWVLIALSLVSAAVGSLLVSAQITTMTTTLLDGTATGIEVYVGQSWTVVGAALLGAGVIGILLALVVAAAKALLPAAAPVVVEPIDWTADSSRDETSTESAETSSASEDEARTGEEEAPASSVLSDDANVDEEEDQNGSSGSIAMATNSSVK